MSNLLAECCCGSTPVCCDCSLATAYSVAASAGWTKSSLDGPTGSVQTMTVAASIPSTTMTLADPACVTGITGSISNPTGAYAAKRYAPPATGTASLVATSSGTCSSISAINEAGSYSGPYVGTINGIGLTCFHEITADGSFNNHFWTMGLGWTSTATCASGFPPPPEFSWRFLAYSTPQSSCHAPPSSGWTFNAPASGSTAANSNVIAALVANNHSAFTCDSNVYCSITSYGASAYTSGSVTVS